MDGGEFGESGVIVLKSSPANKGGVALSGLGGNRRPTIPLGLRNPFEKPRRFSGQVCGGFSSEVRDFTRSSTTILRS